MPDEPADGKVDGTADSDEGGPPDAEEPAAAAAASPVVIRRVVRRRQPTTRTVRRVVRRAPAPGRTQRTVVQRNPDGTRRVVRRERPVGDTVADDGPRAVLASVDGLDRAARDALLTAFGSLEDVAAASVEELARVASVDVRTAAALRRRLRDR